MGLFDRMFGVQNTVQETFSPAEAYAAIALAAVASDGYLADEELSGLMNTLNRMQLFRSYSSDIMRRMFDKLFSILRRDGIGVLFAIAKDSLPFELKESAFAVATDLVLADGRITQEEQQFLDDLYQALGVSEAAAEKIVDVMLIKNRG
ncbi:MAG: tellurite resistance TerB family protein [Cyanobacteriota bacterium]